ncbi:phosphopentomutase-like [Bactrocera neohumeralis]|uniref:phosphopentomutase-like n=1 Tax=Bactrocera neohumeralis TaxID=98809 RepID=UPI002165CF79|nr:phosphopentomutase-like [Bactrocera neohumeralis]
MSSPELQAKIDQWLKWDKCEKTRNEILNLVQSNNWNQLKQVLLQRVEFGTAGLRGRMRAGFNGMNELVVVQAAQGLSTYMRTQFSENECRTRGIVFGFDGRHNSKRFAELSSNIFVRAGFRVYLFRQMVLTPMIPFSIKHFKCLAGVMVTASHNPKDDNGYKVYWENSAQIVPPHDKHIHNRILENLEPWEDSFDTNGLYICTCLLADPKDAITAYVQRVQAGVPQEFIDINSRSELRFVYTAMHGVGYPFLQKVFEAVRIKPVIYVKEQNDPDPEFPTVAFPNPEEGRVALDMAINLAEREDVEYVIANDPDADRFALVTRNPMTREWKIYKGNEIGALLGWWAMFLYKNQNPCPDFKNCWMIASTVSSKILKAYAHKEGFNFIETLTGFKWMANEADRLIKSGKTVLFSFEESIGFMFGTTVYDKDGVNAACQVVTMANYLHAVKGISLDQKLEEIYKEYGFHYNNASYFFCYEPVVINKIFERLRNFSGSPKTYPNAILNGKYKIQFIRDLTNGVDTEQPDGNAILPVSASTQMITFKFFNGLVITLRTSGTEPKIKYYAEMCAQPGQSDFEALINTTNEMVSAIIEEFLQPSVNNLTPKAD